jgi:hypothetical protein
MSPKTGKNARTKGCNETTSAIGGDCRCDTGKVGVRRFNPVNPDHHKTVMQNNSLT